MGVEHREWEDFGLPLVVTKITKKGHRVIWANRAFKEAFPQFSNLGEGGFLEDLFGPYFESSGLQYFTHLGKPFYYLGLPLGKRRRIYVLIEENLWLRFPHWYHTERLASLGKLAGEISHELNNPLGGILLYANMLKEELSSNTRLQEYVDKIIALTTRCRIISRALLDFGKPERGKKEWVNLNQIIQNIYNLISDYQVFKKVKFVFNLDPDLPPFYANPTQMEQVFLNLFTNAVEAMKGEGTIWIETKGREDRIIIRVTDSGPGIPPEIMPLIFDPFFTTKSSGKGTGLGLSICHSIIKRHGGLIRVENLPDRGASFEIIFPLATREALREDAF